MSTMAYSICTRSLLLYFLLSAFGNFVAAHSRFWVMGQGVLDHSTCVTLLLWNARSKFLSFSHHHPKIITVSVHFSFSLIIQMPLGNMEEDKVQRGGQPHETKSKNLIIRQPNLVVPHTLKIHIDYNIHSVSVFTQPFLGRDGGLGKQKTSLVCLISTDQKSFLKFVHMATVQFISSLV